MIGASFKSYPNYPDFITDFLFVVLEDGAASIIVNYEDTAGVVQSLNQKVLNGNSLTVVPECFDNFDADIEIAAALLRGSGIRTCGWRGVRTHRKPPSGSEAADHVFIEFHRQRQARDIHAFIETVDGGQLLVGDMEGSKAQTGVGNDAHIAAVAAAGHDVRGGADAREDFPHRFFDQAEFRAVPIR